MTTRNVAAIKSHGPWEGQSTVAFAKRAVLIPARLDGVAPPLGFTTIHVCDLKDWDGSSDSSLLEELVERTPENDFDRFRVLDQVAGDDAPFDLLGQHLVESLLQ